MRTNHWIAPTLTVVIVATRPIEDETQEKLAERADLTAKYLGEVERGFVNISVDALARLAKALELRINHLNRKI